MSNSAVRKQRDEQDTLRMVYRRAIEERAEMRRLSQELDVDPERLTGFFLNPGLAALR